MYDEEQSFWYEYRGYLIVITLELEADNPRCQDVGGTIFSANVTLRSYRDFIDGEKRECIVISGEGACPPDDVGGVWGDADLLYTLEHPQEDRELFEEYMDWLPEDFDPHMYDVEKENKFLKSLKF